MGGMANWLKLTQFMWRGKLLLLLKALPEPLVHKWLRPRLTGKSR